MRPPICFDLTHQVTQLGVPSPSGIDQVDLAYAKHFVERQLGPYVHYGLVWPHILNVDHARSIMRTVRQTSWSRDEGDDPEFNRVRSTLIGDPPPVVRDVSSPESSRVRAWSRRERFIGRWFFRLQSELKRVPKNAIYLNVAQHAFEIPRYFRWLKYRPDVRTVFLLHDLLPLDYPEYFREGYKEVFLQRINLALKHGCAFIVTSEVVRARLERELEYRRLTPRPMLVAPLPTSLPQPDAGDREDEALASVPYFMVVGTIEPRKNHMLLLNAWRHLAERAEVNGEAVPKLVIVGGRGWENEQVLDVLDRGRLTRPYLLETRGLSPTGLARLLASARALLMPSWAEGYGIPLVDALTAGTPVVTTDAPVFREVTQGLARFQSPIDGLGWVDAIRALADTSSEEAKAGKARAAMFRPPRWDDHFARVETFLDQVARHTSPPREQ